MTMSIVEKLKKAHSARSIEQKDFSLRDMFSTKEKEKVIEVVGFASKFVEKYKMDGNKGYHTMIYLKDGQKTGAFSGALYEFASFFYQGVGLDTASDFNKVMFAEDGYLKVKVTLIDLKGGHTTYNFEILDGSVSKFERIGRGENDSTPMMLQAGAEVIEE